MAMIMVPVKRMGTGTTQTMTRQVCDRLSPYFGNLHEGLLQRLITPGIRLKLTTARTTTTISTHRVHWR